MQVGNVPCKIKSYRNKSNSGTLSKMSVEGPFCKMSFASINTNLFTKHDIKRHLYPFKVSH